MLKYIQILNTTHAFQRSGKIDTVKHLAQEDKKDKRFMHSLTVQMLK